MPYTGIWPKRFASLCILISINALAERRYVTPAPSYSSGGASQAAANAAFYARQQAEAQQRAALNAQFYARQQAEAQQRAALSAQFYRNNPSYSSYSSGPSFYSTSPNSLAAQPQYYEPQVVRPTEPPPPLPPYNATSPTWHPRGNTVGVDNLPIPVHAREYRYISTGPYRFIEYRPHRADTSIPDERNTLAIRHIDEHGMPGDTTRLYSRTERINRVTATFTAKRAERGTEHAAYLERARTHWRTQQTTYQSTWYSNQVAAMDTSIGRTFGQNPPAEIRASVLTSLDGENEARTTYFTDLLRNIEALLTQETAAFNQTDAIYATAQARIATEVNNETGITGRDSSGGFIRAVVFHTNADALLVNANAAAARSNYDTSRAPYAAARTERGSSFNAQVATWNAFSSTDALVRTAVTVYRADQTRRTAIRTSRDRFVATLNTAAATFTNRYPTTSSATLNVVHGSNTVVGGQRARMILQVDPNAEIHIDGRPTTTPGTSRLFETPPLTQDGQYAIRVRVGDETREFTVNVSPGTERTFNLNFERPAAPLIAQHEAWYARQIQRLDEKLGRDFTGSEPSEAIRAPLAARLLTEIQARRTHFNHPENGRTARATAESARRTAFLERINTTFESYVTNATGTTTDADAEVARLWATESAHRTRWEAEMDTFIREFDTARTTAWGALDSNPIDSLYAAAIRPQLSAIRCDRVQLEKDMKQTRTVKFSNPVQSGERTWTALFTFGRATQRAAEPRPVVTRTGGIRGFACRGTTSVLVVDWADVPEGTARENGLDERITQARTSSARRWALIFDGNRLKNILQPTEAALAFGRVKLFSDENLGFTDELILFNYSTQPNLRFAAPFAYRVTNTFQLARAGGPFTEPAADAFEDAR